MSRQPPKTQGDLDDQPCDNPSCTHEACDELWLHARCHPAAALYVWYAKPEGVLHVVCAQCRQGVTSFEIAL